MRHFINLETPVREELVDIADRVRAVTRAAVVSGVRDGLVALYAQDATAAIMIPGGLGCRRAHGRGGFFAHADSPGPVAARPPA